MARSSDSDMEYIMKRIGLFVDCSNLYAGLIARGKLDYARYVEYLDDLGTVTIQMAYGSQGAGKAKAFIKALNELGFVTFFTEGQVADVSITMDVVRHRGDLDMIVIGSGALSLMPLAVECAKLGKQVIVFAADGLRHYENTPVETISIPASMLMAKATTQATTKVPT